MIRSHRTFYYGYYEARVFLPNAKGVWPAFWLEADYDIDGKTWHPPEIDIFEYVINGVEDKANSLHSNVVAPFNEKQYTYVDKDFLLKYQNMYASEDLNLGWHIVGFVWAPDRISMFWDGKLVYTRMYQWKRNDGQLGPPAHVDLNFAVGGAWAGRHGIDDVAFPQSFKIDYVRVCQFTESDKGASQCGPAQVTPDPKEFGYSTTINDMPKPAFLPVKVLGEQQQANGVLSVKGADPLKLEIPIDVPENYPSNRRLQVWVYDPTARSMVTTVERKLQESTVKKRADGASVVELSLPALQRTGNLVLDAKLVAETTDDKGARQVLPSPITCRTDVAQPIKARSCRLLTLEAR